MAKKVKHKRERRLLAPRRLAEKLKQIRDCVNLTQAKMVVVVNPFETKRHRARISQYERNIRIPSTVEISNYAKFVGISTDVLLDDELDLPVGLCRAEGNGKAATIPPAVVNEALGRIILSDESPTDDTPTDTNGHGSGTNTTENELSDKPTDLTNKSVKASGTGNDADKAEEILPAQSEKAEIPVASTDPADSCVEVGEQAISEAAPSAANQSLTDPCCQIYKPDAVTEEDEILGENQRRVMPIAAQTLFRLGEMYLELLPLLAHERWSKMSFDIFIEQVIAVGINDYEQRKTESAIACRLRAGS